MHQDIESFKRVNVTVYHMRVIVIIICVLFALFGVFFCIKYHKLEKKITGQKMELDVGIIDTKITRNTTAAPSLKIKLFNEW